MKLTFYLMESSVNEFVDAIDSAKLAGDDPYEEIPVSGDLDFEAHAFLQRNKPTTPKWTEFFGSHLDLPNDLRNTTNSLLFLIKIDNRIFAVTAGFAFTAVDRARIEPNFGLKVTLNSVNPAGLKAVDSRRIDNRATQKLVLVSKESRLGDFDFDIDEEILNLMSGSPSDASFARRLVGSDSLSITGNYSLPELGVKCQALLEAFNSDAYLEHFDFIDHLRIEKDEDIRHELKEMLNEALSNRQDERLILAYPEIEFWSRAERYKVTANRRSGEIEDVTLEEVYRVIDELGGDEIDSERVHIVGLDGDGNSVTARRSLFEYAVYEVQHGGGRYLLSSSKWYQIADNYIAEVDDAIERIEQIQGPYLPPIVSGMKEGEYNESCETEGRVSLDKDLFTDLPGRSSVEICDLLTRHREFIIVKRYNGSSTLSHMFAQGYVSAELLHEYPEYRQSVVNHAPPGWPPVLDVEDLDPRSITFVFAIAGTSAATLVEALPFFSKVNLRKTVRDIERMNFRVKGYLVPPAPGTEGESQ